MLVVGHNAQYWPMELHPSCLTLHLHFVSFLGSLKVVSEKSLFYIFFVNLIYVQVLPDFEAKRQI